MSEPAQENQTLSVDVDEDSSNIESRIKEAVCSCACYFKQNSISLTFKEVRKIMEEDIGLGRHVLDIHKMYIKKCLLECLDGDVTDSICKSDDDIKDHIHSEINEATEPSEGMSKDVIMLYSGDETTKDYPLLVGGKGQKQAQSQCLKTNDTDNEDFLSESIIINALWKRASYIKANSDTITMGRLRRLLEEDLEIVRYSLDPCKRIIGRELDKILNGGYIMKPEEKMYMKNFHVEASQSASRVNDSVFSTISGSGREEIQMKKKPKPMEKMLNSEGSKKRKRWPKELKSSSKKQIKPMESIPEDNIDAKHVEADSKEGHSQLVTEKLSKKKRTPLQSYGKHVEHLKSVLKSYGLSIPPIIYRRVKQELEDKQEAHLMKELENLLLKEGLSSDPTEKEIKEVRKRREKEKELEGIDLSNIVSTSRRRSSISCGTMLKQKLPSQSSSDDFDSINNGAYKVSEKDDGDEKEEDNSVKEDVGCNVDNNQCRISCG